MKSISLLCLAAVFFLIGCAPQETPEDSNVYAATFVLPTAEPTLLPTPSSTPVLQTTNITTTNSSQPTSLPDEAFALVARVIDGNTISVIFDGDRLSDEHTVRYIGIDVPPNTNTDPWGVVAFETNTKLASLKVVRLVRDETDYDEEGYLLRHVYLENQLMSIVLAEAGLASVRSDEENTQFDDQIAAAERQARAESLGIWGNAPPTPTATSTPTPEPAEGTTEPTTELTDATNEAVPVETTDEATVEATEIPSDEATEEPSETVIPEASLEATEEPTTEPESTSEATPSDEPTAEPTIEDTNENLNGTEESSN